MVESDDPRLEALGTDYIDLLYFHALSGKAVDFGLSGNEMDWPKSKEMKETIAAIKKTGKVRFVGFATHDQRRAEQLEAKIASLQRENDYLRQQRDILKKTLGILSEPPTNGIGGLTR